MIADLFYWTGALVWACFGGVATWLAIEIAIGFCCAVSFYLWASRVGQVQGVKMFKRPARAFLSLWAEYVGYRNNGDVKVTGPGGYWRGIGDNLVLPKVENETTRGE